MEKFGLIVNMKRVTRALLLLMFGLSLMFYGIISFYFDYTRTHSTLSDQQIIERAKALGMVEPKDIILNQEDEVNDQSN